MDVKPPNLTTVRLRSGRETDKKSRHVFTQHGRSNTCTGLRWGMLSECGQTGTSTGRKNPGEAHPHPPLPTPTGSLAQSCSHPEISKHRTTGHRLQLQGLILFRVLKCPNPGLSRMVSSPVVLFWIVSSRYCPHYCHLIREGCGGRHSSLALSLMPFLSR